MLFAKRALEERPTHGVCVNDNAACSLQYIANAPLINNPARKLCVIELRVSAINVFQQPLKFDNEEIDCDVAEFDQKTKLFLHVIFQSSIILLSQFCSLYAKRSQYCVLYFITYQSLLHDCYSI